MPALAGDIAAGTRPARIETWSDAALKARYPNALDGSDAPSEGFFDAATDAAAALTARAALIGVERRRFAVTVADLVWPNPAGGIPSVTLIDPEHAVNGVGLIARIELDLQAETTSYEVLI
jgi:hypothetical protein